MFVADNGSDWYITGATDTRWNDNELNQAQVRPGRCVRGRADRDDHPLSAGGSRS